MSDRKQIESRLKEAEAIVRECREKLAEPAFRHGDVVLWNFGAVRVAIKTGGKVLGHHNHEGLEPQVFTPAHCTVLWNIFDSLLPPDVAECLLRATTGSRCIWSPSDVRKLCEKYGVKRES